jgi:hypothetical protein
MSSVSNKRKSAENKTQKKFSEQDPEDTQEELSDEDLISERVILVKNSLLSAYYQNRWDRVGLQQIINRISLLFLERCIIVILKKTSETRYEIAHHTCLDPFWKVDFEEYLETKLYKGFLVQEEKDRIVIDTKKMSNRKILAVSFDQDPSTFYKNEPQDFTNNIIEFYKDTFFIFHRVISATENKKANPNVKERTFPLISIEKNVFLKKLAEKLTKLFDNPNVKAYLTNNAIDEIIEKKTNQWEGRRINKDKDNTLELYADDSKALEQYWPEEGEKYFDNHFEKIKKIFDEEYKKIQQSPLLTGESNVPNIFFTVRTFSQKEKRFHDDKHPKGAYPYSIRLIIPEKQEDALKEAFSKYWKDYSHLNPEDRPHFSDDENVKIIDDFFWENIKTKKGITKILEGLKIAAGLCVRRITDPAFESGYISIRNDPFIFGGRNSIEEEFFNSKGDINFQRYVYFHYMLLMLSPKKDISQNHKEDKLFALTAPGSVGGSPFFCVGFVFTRKNQRDHQSWLQCFHFYNSIRHHLLRNIRKKIRNLYMDEIQSIYVNNQEDILDRIVTNDIFNPDNVCDKLNPKFQELSRVYPFQYIELKYVSPVEKEASQKDHTFLFFLNYLGSNALFAVHIHDNPFFVSHISSVKFLGDTRIKECLQEADSKLETIFDEKIVDYETKKSP